MGRLIFVTGGQRSGKSAFAEDLCKRYADVTYIATGMALDAEMKSRINAHRARRSASWKTVEAALDASGAAAAADSECVLIDSVSSLVTNIMYQYPPDDEPTAEQRAGISGRVSGETDRLIQAIRASNAVFVVVSDETGMGLISEYAHGRLFCDLLGRANQALAQSSDEAYLLVSGLPLRLR